MKKEIVRYDPENPDHRAAVRRIVWGTGFGGAPMDPFFDNFDLFCDMLVLYYTDYDPGHNFLAMVDGEIAGYLLGCPDTRAYETCMKKEISPLLLRRLLTGGYKLSGKDVAYIARSVSVLLRGEYTHPPLNLFPAHLHIDFFQQYRRMGLGSQIIETYEDYLRGLGARGLHLGTSSFHRSALPFYLKLGFSVYSRVRVSERFYAEATQEDMYSILYVKRL